MKGLIPLIVVATAGCMSPGEGESGGVANDNASPAFSGDEGTCNPDAAKPLIGRERSADVEAEALKLSGAEKARWLRPGDAMTMDYSPTRLNISVDDAGKIISFRCG